MGYPLNTTTSLHEVLAYLNIEYAHLKDIAISNIAKQDDVVNGSLSFTKSVYDNDIEAAFFVPLDFEGPSNSKIVYIKVNNPRLTFIRALDYLVNTIGFSHFNELPQIHPSVKIGQNVVIENGCIIEEGAVLEHNVVIQAGTKIGKFTRIRTNASIGGDGFGFERLDNGEVIRFPHLGGVVIGDYVEIGANTCIARGTLSDTIIKDYVKIDNLVHIAHNCVIEEGVFITACAELSGGVHVGKNAWIAPNVSVVQKLEIGANSLVGIGAVLTKSVKENALYIGNPARFVRNI